MRKFAALFLFVLAGGLVAMAQSTAPLFAIPKNEISFGYAYEHASLNGGFAATQTLVPETSAGLNGFAFGFSHYLNLLHGNLGYTIDFSRNSSKEVEAAPVAPTGIGYSNESYTVGPTYRLPRYGFFSPSIHVLAGGSHSTYTVPTIGGSKLSFADSNFAALAGGTLDGNLTPHIAIRLAQIDYDYSHHYGASQSSFRYLGGIVFRF